MAMAGYFPAPERKRQILEAAKRVFAERGYHDTNISHICADLGIGRGTLYQYFKSKREVFSAIVEGLLARLRLAVEAEPPVVIPEGVKPPRALILAYSAASLRRCLEAVFEDEASLRIVLREAVGLDVGIDGILRAIDDIVIDRFTEDLRIAQRAGIIRADVDARSAALFTVGGVQKLALDVIARGETGVDLNALAKQATRLNMMGILEEGL